MQIVVFKWKRLREEFIQDCGIIKLIILLNN